MDHSAAAADRRANMKSAPTKNSEALLLIRMVMRSPLAKTRVRQASALFQPSRDHDHVTRL